MPGGRSIVRPSAFNPAGIDKNRPRPSPSSMSTDRQHHHHQQQHGSHHLLLKAFAPDRNVCFLLLMSVGSASVIIKVKDIPFPTTIREQQYHHKKNTTPTTQHHQREMQNPMLAAICNKITHVHAKNVQKCKNDQDIRGRAAAFARRRARARVRKARCCSVNATHDQSSQPFSHVMFRTYGAVQKFTHIAHRGDGSAVANPPPAFVHVGAGAFLSLLLFD